MRIVRQVISIYAMLAAHLHVNMHVYMHACVGISIFYQNNAKHYPEKFG